MTDRIDAAAKVIREESRGLSTAERIARALDGAGLLAKPEQDEQIKRLQGVIRNLDAGRGGDLIGPLVDNGVLTAEDMEDTDE